MTLNGDPQSNYLFQAAVVVFVVVVANAVGLQAVVVAAVVLQAAFAIGAVGLQAVVVVAAVNL